MTQAADVNDSRTWPRLGRVGVWSNLDHLDGQEVLAFAQAVESLGFGALWIQEGVGREPFATLGALTETTSRITLGVGIASIYARDAAAARAGALTLAEMSGGRFILGLGVSHRSRVEEQRGHQYRPPIDAMRTYMDAYDRAPFQARTPAHSPPVVLAALRSRMLELAAARADGAFPYFVPATHLVRARSILDEAAAEAGLAVRPRLIAALPVVGQSDTMEARTTARTFAAPYLRLPNYVRNLRECGFTEDDLETTGSNRLIDAVVAWGDSATIARRFHELLDAGCDHVALIPLAADARHGHVRTLEALAPLVT